MCVCVGGGGERVPQAPRSYAPGMMLREVELYTSKARAVLKDVLNPELNKEKRNYFINNEDYLTMSIYQSVCFGGDVKEKGESDRGIKLR